jgi:hypothetical protein
MKEHNLFKMITVALKKQRYNMTGYAKLYIRKIADIGTNLILRIQGTGIKPNPS